MHLKRMTSLFEHVTVEKQQSQQHHGDGRSMSELQQKRASTGSLVLTLNPLQRDPVIVHAEAVVSFLHLIPAIPHSNVAPNVNKITEKQQQQH